MGVKPEQWEQNLISNNNNTLIKLISLVLFFLNVASRKLKITYVAPLHFYWVAPGFRQRVSIVKKETFEDSTDGAFHDVALVKRGT